MVFRSNGVITA